MSGKKLQNRSMKLYRDSEKNKSEVKSNYLANNNSTEEDNHLSPNEPNTKGTEYKFMQE